jgi:TonB-dependent starch-binding outer membrane protein SusC
MKKIIIVLSVLLLAVVSHGFAQNKTITGTITSAEDKEPVPGVSIKITGAKSGGTQTNANGEYTFEVPQDIQSLTFSTVGYISQEVNVGAKTKVDVVMVPDKKVLDELVVMGYGVQNKKDVTSAVSTISGETIKDAPVQSFDQALAGKATGVEITLPNGVLNNAPVIRVRGINSISNSSYPLVILDGVPLFSQSAFANIPTNSAANNPLGDINPSDIESVDILKDAAATAVYGSRAANGVMVVTTKKGKAASKINVVYNSWLGISRVYNMPELLNAKQYIDIKNEARRNANLTDAYFISTNADGSEVNTRWADVVYQTGMSTNNNISMSGATDVTSYYLSLGFSDQNGFIKRNEFQRKSIHFNLDQQVVKRIKVGTTLNYTSSYNAAPNTGSLPGEGFQVAGLGRLAFLTAPNVAPKNPDGSYNITTTNSMGLSNNLAQTGTFNPLVILEKNNFSSSSNHLITSVFSELEIFKSLKFKTTFLSDNNGIEVLSYLNPLHGDGFTNHGSANNVSVKLSNTGWTNFLNFQKVFAEKHSVMILAGTEQLYSVSNSWGGSRQNIADDFFETYQGNFLITNPPAALNFQGENGFLSYFTWATYDFKKKYYFTASARRDGFSGLAEGNKFGNFWGASAGWALSEETFFKNSSLSNHINNVRWEIWAFLILAHCRCIIHLYMPM